MEEWRDVPGYEGKYQVSSQGRVKSLARVVSHPTNKSGVATLRERLLKPGIDSTGSSPYIKYNLSEGGRSRTHPVHSLMLLAFVGPRPKDYEGCHNNGDSFDNRIENLRWDTRAKNQQDSVNHGRHPHASKTHCPSNHVYSEENTGTYTDKFGKTRRYCRTCKNSASLKYYYTSRV